MLVVMAEPPRRAVPCASSAGASGVCGVRVRCMGLAIACRVAVMVDAVQPVSCSEWVRVIQCKKLRGSYTPCDRV